MAKKYRYSIFWLFFSAQVSLNEHPYQGLNLGPSAWKTCVVALKLHVNKGCSILLNSQDQQWYPQNSVFSTAVSHILKQKFCPQC